MVLQVSKARGMKACWAAIVATACFAAGDLVAADSSGFERLELGLRIGSGTGLVRDTERKDSLATGLGELAIGLSTHANKGLFANVVLQGHAMSDQAAHSRTPDQRWSGSTVGLRVGGRYGLLSGWAGFSFGSLSRDLSREEIVATGACGDDSDTDVHCTKSFVADTWGPEAGVSIALIRLRQFRLELTGSGQILEMSDYRNVSGSEIDVPGSVVLTQVGLNALFTLPLDDSGSSSANCCRGNYTANVWFDPVGSAQVLEVLVHGLALVGEIGARAAIHAIAR